MDGFHDMGGRQGFGPVVMNDKREPFHDEWEVRAAAISARLIGQHVYNMDEFRHAIERMAPRHYVCASYFERTFTAAATLCFEKGLISREELNAASGESVPLSLPAKPGRVAPDDLPKLKIGDWVKVKNEFVGGHTRAPAYVRGKCGQIVDISPACPFPDAAAHDLEPVPQCTFDVRFRSVDLWPECCDEAEVHVGLFHGYLEKAPLPTASYGSDSA
ncbi:nitrile hydratase subunit beta [Paraburkholderia oxyphila]|uniref:nitrile hydratase subunit beta n=1 Tax=Paraburkholderia oxyphila TaxID=614212 RepID=UPI0004875363|nr:nitrile hydratase subunit beta [Paraburkholderia oxyphila]